MNNDVFELIFQQDGTLQYLSELLVFNIRTAFLLLLCLLFVRRLKLSAATLHVILVSALIATLFIPFYSRIIPSLNINIVLDAPIVEKSLINLSEVSNLLSSIVKDGNDESVVLNESGLISLSSNNTFSGVSSVIGWANILASFYLIGLLFVLMKIVWSNFVILLVTIHSNRCKHPQWNWLANRHAFNFWIRRPLEVRCSSAITSPMTWGFFKPVILIPKDALNWPEELIKSTLLHELSHIKRGDWLVKQLVRCVCAVYWVNPIVWCVAKKIIANAETAADDMALSAGLKKLDYASDLVTVAEKFTHRSLVNFSAVGMAAARSELSARISKILNPNSAHQQATLNGLAVSIVMIFGVALPLSSVQPKFQKIIIESDENMLVPLNKFSMLDGANNFLASNESVVDKITRNVFVDEFALSEFDRIKHQLSKGIRSMYPSEFESVAGKSDRDKKSIKKTIKKVEQRVVDISSKEALILATNKLQVVAKNNIEKAGFNADPEVNKKAGDLKSTVSLLPASDSPHDVIKEDGEIGRPDSASLFVSFLTESSTQRTENTELKPRRMFKPKYPENARRKGIEGEVVVRYEVSAEGKIINPVIIEASPQGVFDKSVIKALSRSSYRVPNVSKVEAKAIGQVQELYKFVLNT